MELTFVRHLKLNKYIYESKDYHSESNYTLDIWLRKLTAFSKDNEPIYVLRQTNWLNKIITWIPIYWILPIDLFPTYKFYDRGECIGKTEVSFYSSSRIININNNRYELYSHINNYVSILKNDIQIALIKKAEITIEEQNTYSINLDENLENNMSLIALFVAFIDVIFFPNHYRLDAEKKEKTVGFDKLYSRTSWKPQSERGEESKVIINVT